MVSKIQVSKAVCCCMATGRQRTPGHAASSCQLLDAMDNKNDEIMLVTSALGDLSLASWEG